MSNGSKVLTLTIAGGYIAPNFVFTYHFVDGLFLYKRSPGMSDTACD
jgi:hypothetical protein